MRDFFILRPDLPTIDLKDAIHSHLNKTKAILRCAMFATEFIRDDVKLDDNTLYHVLWVADDHLEDIEMLLTQLESQKS